jgi:ankyrin repeat protein
VSIFELLSWFCAQEKIAQVHEAAARGDLAALQTALERRKFVTSRDQFGATPLHKAVLFRQVNYSLIPAEM